MRKFLDTFPNVTIEQLYSVYPRYDSFLKELQSLDKKVKKGVSPQIEEQYELLMNTFDTFLFKPESIERFNKTYTNPLAQLDLSLLPKKGVALPIEEREEIEEDLEREIKELSDKYQIDQKRIEEIIEEDESVKPKLIGQDIPTRTKEDFDEEDRFVGITWNYDSFKQSEFKLALAMMKQGCKFYYTTYASKHFALFKLKGMGRIIIETSEERYSYENLFQSSSQDLKVYMLNDNEKSLETIFNVFKDAWDMDVDSYSKVDDEFLYNTPYILSSIKLDILWKEAEILQQSKSIAYASNYITKYFSLYTPLEKICTLQMCKEVHSNLNVDRNVKAQIEDNIKTQSFYIEGIGNVRHSENILEELVKDNFLDINYNPTGLGIVMLSYNMTGQPLLNPSFKPFMYYMNDLGKELKNAKKTFYSSFNGTTLYHTKPFVQDITFALAIPSAELQAMGVDDAIQEDSFSMKWQQEQNFREYQQYLPFGAGGNLSIRKMHEAREQRGSTKDKIMFRDLDRKELYIAGTINPNFNYAINGQDYRYICSMYGEDNIRILGPNESPYVGSPIVFFQIVDANNNLLAVQAAIKSKAPTTMKETSKGVWEEEKQDLAFLERENKKQEELKFKGSYINVPAGRYPSEVWDYDEVIEKIETLDPVLTLEGKMIGSREEIAPAKIDEKVEEKPEEDIIIDLDNPEEPIVVVEDERTIQTRELNTELLALQEYVDMVGEDEEAEEEIRIIKEKIEALK
tara:strand:- start:167 stop:2392 length:2226 start_codon:yes stop_codon:yes gene_type:complete